MIHVKLDRLNPLLLSPRNEDSLEFKVVKEDDSRICDILYVAL